MNSGRTFCVRVNCGVGIDGEKRGVGVVIIVCGNLRWIVWDGGAVVDSKS